MIDSVLIGYGRAQLVKIEGTRPVHSGKAHLFCLLVLKFNVLYVVAENDLRTKLTQSDLNVDKCFQESIYCRILTTLHMTDYVRNILL